MSKEQPEQPSEAELAEMSRDDLVKLGGKLDGVEIVEYPDPWPVKGTRAEKRAERLVALWFAIAGLSGLAFVGVFLWWPWQYTAPDDSSGHFLYGLYTPLVGLTLGLSITAIGVGVVLYTKKFLPHEVTVQQRHDAGGSSELDRQTVLAHLADAGTKNGIGRRSLIKRSVGFGLGAFGLAGGVFALGGLIRDPWKNTENHEGLWHTEWQARNGERVFLRRSTGDPHEIALVRPEDLEAGSMETVFPFRESDREDEDALLHAMKSADSPVMLIRLRPDDGRKVVKRAGQEDYNFGDYYAYTKICSHLGCPTSLYEQQTNRILCPCHQSQFDALQYAKPVFGPATRALAQLPIDVDPETGYFYARDDFNEAVGPAFWERKS
ncbi:menaquinol-cytochrome c reductase iron-sulfur subunit precursor [Tamaricihabitans halophyticus]|uniref:Cytochrome bc1 complex Rieske iron-sulfur subunit n=1 Tax=Tamaricihabitans halophyticus TaxID=1262583 RepID=A0A4R2R0V8_9PSEU|nr:ubiquinol-cytochrome c reductase iron-sulfur subunit [Tamaricihabitans halophyticus]TCP55098.1 menaquinol-cytochrome c reductase iron-sulfur subunit precursor [Tamaricihabitans halophyticus]